MTAPIPSLRTPLGRARGLGSAKDGAGHFIAQRASAAALAVLAPWFVISAALSLKRGGYDEAAAWVSHPVNAVLLALFAAVAFYHMRLGMQVIIEDYIAKHGMRLALLLLNGAVAVVLTTLAVFSILRISFGG